MLGIARRSTTLLFKSVWDFRDLWHVGPLSGQVIHLGYRARFHPEQIVAGTGS